MAASRPPPPPPSGLRAFWKRRSAIGQTAIIVGQTAIIVGAVLVVMIVIGRAASVEHTGRMSEGQFEEFSGALTEVDQKVQHFGITLHWCGVLFQALELAVARQCVDDAYNGFGDKVFFASFVVDDLRDNVAKGCLIAMNAYGVRANHFANYIANLHGAGANLQVDDFRRIRKQAVKETRRYAAARNLALIACAPR